MLSADAFVDLKTLRPKVDALSLEAEGLRSKLILLEEQRVTSVERAQEAEADGQLVLQARLLLETFSEEAQEALRARVEGLVSRGLQVIFGSDYGFRVEVGQSRGQAAMLFRIISADGERDPLQSHGGGIVNVVSFVLRVVVAALTPGLSRCLILDEPFAQLSNEYLEPMAEFLRELVDVTDLQLLIVSHEPEVAAVADKAYRLRKVGGRTVADAIR